MFDEPLLYDVTRLVWRRWSGSRITGIDRACLAYLDRFSEQSLAVIQHRRMRRIFSGHASRQLSALLRHPGTGFRSRFVRFIVRHGWGSQPPGKGRLYLNIGHTGLDSPGYRLWVDEAGVRPVYLVHDLIPITHPQFCRTGERSRHIARMRTVLATAAGIIVNSRRTLDDVEEFARAEQLDCPPSIVAWLGVTPIAVPPRRQQGPDRATFVMLGTIEGRKNHLLLLNLWSRLVTRFGEATPRLLIIGQRGWEAAPVFDLLDRSKTLLGHVVEVSHCTDDGVATHLVNARALLFPSLAEGFGLPLIEALSLGIPVIASDLPVFHEIARDLPDYLSPTDESAWEAAILDYARPDSAARLAQCHRIAGYEAPSWADHFGTVERWLKTLRS